MTPVERRTVDLTAYPKLVVIYLGMRVRTWAGIRRLVSDRRLIERAEHVPRDSFISRMESFIGSSPSTWECAGTGRISNRWSDGPALRRTRGGGGIAVIHSNASSLVSGEAANVTASFGRKGQPGFTRCSNAPLPPG